MKISTGSGRNRNSYHSGFVSKPEFAKKNRGEQFFFVNDRLLKVVICIMRLWLPMTES
jgi:DNA mismatch repair ATPase MutL